MKILVTGCAGFIGGALAHRLLGDGHDVAGIDDVNDYYDPALKEARLARLAGPRFRFHRGSVADRDLVGGIFEGGPFDAVVHLAAQAGVRHSLEHPRAYVEANVSGFLEILEGCRRHPTGHLVFASTSSVFGLNAAMPLSVHQPADHPVSFYASTKRANELMAHAYAHLFGIPATGIRFFTVYGPWGRPDMALFSFTKAILEGRPIRIFNHGRSRRDFTYIDDVVESLVRVLAAPPPVPVPGWDAARPDPATSSAPWRLLNIGNGESVELMRYVRAIESALGREAEKLYEGPAAGDVDATLADTSELVALTGFRPSTSVEQGVRRFVEWYRSYAAAT